MIRLLMVLIVALLLSPTVDAKGGRGSHGGGPGRERHHERVAEGIPPGLAEHDRMPEGLEKKDKTPAGWFKGKAWWKKKPEQPASN